MKSISGIHLQNVQAVYGGAEGDLWELIMGHQVHIGGFKSSMALAEKAGIGNGTAGVDLCCCNGAGMRFLVKFRGVSKMTGVDATDKVIEQGKQRCKAEGSAHQINYVKADATKTGLSSEIADFVWGEDAWCYVEDKPALIKEAVRITKQGGTIAFTDWIEGSTPMSPEEVERYLKFMKFPSIYSIQDYSNELKKNGCDVLVAEDTKLFAPCCDLYLKMVDMQLTSDALRIICNDTNMLQAIAGEMMFMQTLANEGKIAQGRFVARRK